MELQPKHFQEEKLKQKQEFKYVGSIRRIKGLFLWSYNPNSKELKKVHIDRSVNIGLDRKAKIKSTATYDPKLFYCQALNEKNAWKKVKKQFS